MAKQPIHPTNGLIPASALTFPTVNVVPPRPPQHIQLLNPLGIRPRMGKVVVAMARANEPAGEPHKS